MVQEKAEVEQTPKETPPVDVEAIQKQLVSLQMELDQTRKGLSTAHQTLTAKDKELKRQQDIESKIGGIEDRIELLATAFVTRANPDEIGVAEARPDVVKMLKQQREEQEAKRRQQDSLATQQEYAQKADALYTRAKAVFVDDDDAIERVEDLLANGRLERAEARVIKAEQKKTPVKDSKMETEAQRIDRLAEERLQKHLEERGLLETYSNTPSGSGGSALEATRQYAAGEITAEEARKRGTKFE